MLDPCTWGLPHLSLGVAELGAGMFGAPGFQSEKRRGKFLSMFEHFVWSRTLMKDVFWQFLACDLLCGFDGVS